MFSKLSADKLPVSNDRRLKFYFFQGFISNMLCLSLCPLTIRTFISNWPWKRKISQFFLKVQAGKTLFLPRSRIGHVLRPIFIL